MPSEMKPTGNINQPRRGKDRTKTMRRRKFFTRKLEHYMKLRSEFQNVRWGLTLEWLESCFSFGIRLFFGVEIDDEGTLVADFQYPEFFRDYLRSEFQRPKTGLTKAARATRRSRKADL
jgi:hypothetical protein